MFIDIHLTTKLNIEMSLCSLCVAVGLVATAPIVPLGPAAVLSVEQLVCLGLATLCLVMQKDEVYRIYVVISNTLGHWVNQLQLEKARHYASTLRSAEVCCYIIVYRGFFI